MKKSTFRGKLQVFRRVAIPKGICDALEIGLHDTVEIVIRKVK